MGELFEIETPKMLMDINKQLAGFETDIGVITDRPAALAKHKLKTFAGGPANRVAGQSKTTTVGDILKKFDLKINLLLKPWWRSENKDVVRVVEEITRDMNSPADKRRFINAAQAVVRNPILRGDYGDNSQQTEEKKGFNRFLINTGTLFNNIKARLSKNV